MNHEIGAKITIQTVIEIMSARHGWTINETISRLSKLPLYEKLCDLETSLWVDNPNDIADLFDKELNGEVLTLSDFI